MHEGESLYTFGWHDAAFAALLIVILFVLIWNNKMPSIGSFRDFVNVWNSRGGNILILSGGTFYSFRATMRMFYHLIGLVSAGKLDGKDGIVQVAIAFATTTAFGMFSGALIKTMTGSEGGTPVPPSNGSISTVTSSTVAKTESTEAKK